MTKFEGNENQQFLDSKMTLGKNELFFFVAPNC